MYVYCLTVYLTLCMHKREEEDKEEERALGIERQRSTVFPLFKKLHVYMRLGMANLLTTSTFLWGDGGGGVVDAKLSRLQGLG
jgi:hypothetical protein